MTEHITSQAWLSALLKWNQTVLQPCNQSFTRGICTGNPSKVAYEY